MISSTLQQIRQILENSRDGYNPRIFFKTSPGEYASHDAFIGVKNPILRKISKEFRYLAMDDLQVLISSNINEERLLALFIMIHQYKTNSETIYKFYMQNMQYINNWNLVDASAHLILGAYLYDKDRQLLQSLAKSDIMWYRRISIVSTLYFIRKNDLETTIDISKMLLNDKHDLIHKATGWMLRELGKKDERLLVEFLQEHETAMPSTMFRYATERLRA